MARINEAITEGAEIFSAISALESTWYMRNMLLKDSDWAGMAHSLEIRVPLVDLVLTRALMPLMHQYPRPDKRMMADSAWACKTPKPLLNRPKTGFSVPVRQWLISSKSRSVGRGNRAWAQAVYRAALGEN